MKNIFFDNLSIHYINLDSAKSRQIAMMRQFKDLGISLYKKINAVDGKSEDIEIAQHDHHDRALTIGETAAVISYIRLIKDFVLNSKNDFILMCDDDIDFSNSLKINFNFYDTLKYHNPTKYCLKVTALDIEYFFKEDLFINPVELCHPNFTSYGNATIINKKWANSFISSIGSVHDSEYELGKKAIIKYTNNKNNIPSSVIPSCDAILFDNHSFVWRIFGVLNTASTIFPDNSISLLMDPYNKKLDSYISKKIDYNK